MARTLTEIYDALASEKADQIELTELLPDLDSSQQLLADLNTTSRVARWRLMLWVVATAVWAHEKLWDIFKAEVEALAAASHIGTLPWYVEKARGFQYGYDLELVNNVPAYVDDVPEARIIARAAAKEQGGLVLLKVAKDVSGELQPLSAPEMTAFEAYIDEVKMAGVIVNVISELPDLLRLTATVYYDPLVMAADGSLILEPGVKPVEDAVNGYLANLPFNGALVLTQLVDAMQRARGVINPVLEDAQAKYGAFPFAPFTVEYIARAGYLKVADAYPLSTTITYVPNVA